MNIAPHSDIVVSVYHRIHREGPSWANGGPGTEFSIAQHAAAERIAAAADRAAAVLFPDAAQVAATAERITADERIARLAYITADQHRDEDYDRHSK